MATNYPGSLDTSSQQPSPLSTTEMDDAGFEHDVVHTNHSGAIIALETKVGTGSSTAVANSVLAGTGAGTSSWSTSPSLAGLSVDTDTLYVDATNDRVGINTSSPGYSLTVGTPSGNASAQIMAASGSYPQLFFGDGGTNQWHIESTPSGGALYFVETGVGYPLTLLPGNKVGIGTTSVTTGHTLETRGAVLISSTAGAGNSHFPYTDGRFYYTADPETGGTGDHVFRHYSGGSYVEQMRILENGNVGIGDATPSYKLDVAGQIRATGNILAEGNMYVGKNGGGDSNLYFYDDNSNAWREIIWDDSINRFRTSHYFAASRFLFGTSDDGLTAVTGSYGSVQTVGTGAGNYEGYSINGHFVFMSNNTEACGIYNDVDNRWMLLMDNDSYTRLYDSRTGITIGGNPATTTGGGSGGNGYVGINNECGGFSGTTAVVSTTTVAGTTLKRIGFSSSSYEYKTGIEDFNLSDEAFMSLRPITFHPNAQYVDSTGDVTEIAGGHTIVPDDNEAGETAGLIPLRRAGFGLEDLYAREDTMILASEFSPDPNALIALLTKKLQETMIRVAALEAA